MKRRNSPMNDDSGQTLVWVAVGMIVLMGILALAVDVGHLYAERRHMQNAADAGALEAARARCFDNDTAAAAAAKGSAFTTANNSRPDAISQTYSVVPDATNDWQFIATATENTPTYFARVLGISQSTVQATAKAACGPSPVACGLFPLAFDEDIWGDIETQCDQKFYVWTGDAASTNYVPSCETLCDCTKVFDLQGNQIPGALAVADIGRAWLDFTAAASPLNPVDCGGNNGCGAAELKCWITSDSQVILLDNTCVSGTSGVKLGVKNEVNARQGDYVSIPLFDGRCPSGGTGSCSAEGYQISGFGCVQVGGLSPHKVRLDWKATPTPDPLKPNLNFGNYCVDDFMLEVNVGCNKCSTECGKTSGGGDPGSGLKAISLIK